MITVREAKDRLSTVNMRMDRVQGSVQWRVSHMLDGRQDEDKAYYTDDVEDAYLQGMKLGRSTPDVRMDNRVCTTVSGRASAGR